MNDDLLNRALIFAVNAHAGMVRQGTNTPYIVHPMEAVAIVASMTNDKEVIAEDIHGIIDKYLENVKQTLMDWISDIENYYDERVSAMEREM